MVEIPDAIDFGPPKADAWTKPAFKPVITNEEEKKRKFGVELARLNDPFKAACEAIGDNTSLALWVSQNWIYDPIVMASMEAYAEVVENPPTLLDKNQLAAKVLGLVNEKNATGNFYLLDGKDRVSALKLYSDIMGFTSTKGNDLINNTYNQMTIKLVKPEPTEIPKPVPQTIEHEQHQSPVPIKLKLVS